MGWGWREGKKRIPSWRCFVGTRCSFEHVCHVCYYILRNEDSGDSCGGGVGVGVWVGEWGMG